MTVKSTDNDVENAAVTVSEPSLIIDEGDDAEYTIVLGVEPKANVTVTATVPDDAQFTVSPSTLTFTTANWDDAQTVTVTAPQDDDAAGGTSLEVTHAAKGGGYDAADIAAVR